VPTADHHSEYLARAVAALTPAGHRRVDELLDQLAEVVADREWLLRFAKARRVEADTRHVDAGGDDPGRMLDPQELDALMVGFITIRDQEPLDDVVDWANAVVALLEDDAARR
jgi:hypothetical protein